jgi:hypothetical protein
MGMTTESLPIGPAALGQLYPAGSKVKLNRDIWPFFAGDEVIIEYSYWQKYGEAMGFARRDPALSNEYSIRGVRGSMAWVNADDLAAA